jgi:acyl-CoA synthetase (AMP-forming)/AMP-acid ligase II
VISSNTVGGLLYNTAERYPDGTAVVFPDSRQTYSELRGQVDLWARRLLGLGVRPGEHVGLSMTNCPEFIEIVYAIGSIGAVMVPFNPRYRSAELAYVVENSDVSVMIVGRPPGDDLDLLGRLLEALPAATSHSGSDRLELPEAPLLRRIVGLSPSSIDGVVDLDFLDAHASTITDAELFELYARPRVRDAAMILFTSGTTARPKGAVLSHEAMTRTAIALGIERYRLTPADKMWDPLPLFHMSGMLPLMASVAAGTPFLCMPRVDAAEGLRMIREEKATVAFLAFAQLAMDVISQPDYSPSDVETLRIVHTGGYPEVLAKVQAAFPSAIQVNPYGCTEAGGMCATSELSDSDEVRAVYSGRPYTGLEIRVVDEDNVPVPPGVRGEINVRGYAMFDGYYKNPEATAAVMDADGWFHTGDLGELDADGRIRYVSRLKDMLKVGGENVAAVEIENLLCSHPAVNVAAVVGVPHERLAEVPFAFVELAPNVSITEDDLIAYCRGQIASFKVPTAIRFVTDWPMSATKIQKAKLRENLLAENGGFGTD